MKTTKKTKKTTKKIKNVKRCGNCHRQGHNVRTCPRDER